MLSAHTTIRSETARSQEKVAIIVLLSHAKPALPVGQREFAAEVSWDLPSLAPGATSLLDVTVNGARAGDLAQASLVSSTRFIELDAAVWSNNTVRVMARNISGQRSTWRRRRCRSV
ncbi:hypothetical protein [Roseomonas sp. CAU 1739]|uniref:hypothetical protein n=1 Tax=Roseomonas sp. CAU 1739 TaxID=3140364 RepID=UPI00325B4EDA